MIKVKQLTFMAIILMGSFLSSIDVRFGFDCSCIDGRSGHSNNSCNRRRNANCRDWNSLEEGRSATSGKRRRMSSQTKSKRAENGVDHISAPRNVNRQRVEF